MWIYWTKMIWIEKLYLRINTMRCSHNIMRRNQRSSAVPWYRSTYFFYSHRYLKSNKNLLIKISFNWITLRNSKDQSFYMHSRFSEVCFKHQFHIRTTKEDVLYFINEILLIFIKMNLEIFTTWGNSPMIASSPPTIRGLSPRHFPLFPRFCQYFFQTLHTSYEKSHD